MKTEPKPKMKIGIERGNFQTENGKRKTENGKRKAENYFYNLKSSMIELFLCKSRRQIRSIVELCEEFGVRRLVQKESIRTIFIGGARRDPSP